MKSKTVITVVFLIFCATLNAKDYHGVIPMVDNAVQADSLYSSFTQGLQKNNAKAVIDWFEKERQHIELSQEDLKKLAISYAVIDEKSKAVDYAEAYIKKSQSIDIIDASEFESLKEHEGYQRLVSSYKFKIDPWILFFIASGIIGLFVALVINLRKKGDAIANFLIGLFVLCHSLFILHLSLYLTNYSYNVPHSFWATITFSFLYGPLLYFYFKRITARYTFVWRDIIHFIPTLLIVIYFIPIYALPAEIKLERLFNIDENFIAQLNVIVTIKALSLLIYSLLVYRIYVRNKKKNSKGNKQLIKWQRNMTLLNTTYAFAYIVYAFILVSEVVFTRYNNFMLYSQVVILACIVLYVGYTAYVQPRVFSKKYLFDDLLKYQKSGLTQNLSEDLKEQLLKLLNEDKIYKTSDISLDMLSNRLGTTRHNISQVINEHFDMNFFNLVNKFRIREAMRIFKEDNNHNLNIIDVAYDVGFNNKVTFNKAFKEETKVTPSQYIKNHGNKNLATSGVNFR